MFKWLPCISLSASVMSWIDWLMCSRACTTDSLSPHLTPLITVGMLYNKSPVTIVFWGFLPWIIVYCIIWLTIEYIFTFSAGIAATSTSRVTKKKPLALSSPGMLKSSSRFLCNTNKMVKFVIVEYYGTFLYVWRTRIQVSLTPYRRAWHRKKKKESRFLPEICLKTINLMQRVKFLTPLDPSSSS